MSGVDRSLTLELDSPGPNFGFAVPAAWAWAIHHILLSHSFFSKVGIIICYRFTVMIQLGKYVKSLNTWSISAICSEFPFLLLCEIYLVCLKFLLLNFSASHISSEQGWVGKRCGCYEVFFGKNQAWLLWQEQVWLLGTCRYNRIGRGNGNPLQCSCLENPRDGGAWWAAVCGVAQSRTRLKWLGSISSRTYNREGEVGVDYMSIPGRVRGFFLIYFLKTTKRLLFLLSCDLFSSLIFFF